jgi:hypothetical protein
MSNKQSDKAKARQPQQREPISLAPLGFEEALTDLLKTGPHPKEGTTKPLPQKKQRQRSKSADTD